MSETKLKREVLFRPAYDKRHAEPAKNYGIHCVTATWIVTGPLGAVQFQLFTGWHLPHVHKEHDADRYGHDFRKPLPADLGHHSPKPTYEGQEPMESECEVLGGTCYYDGSTLNAEPVFDILVAGGGDALWERLEEEYASVFKSVEVQP